MPHISYVNCRNSKFSTLPNLANSKLKEDLKDSFQLLERHHVIVVKSHGDRFMMPLADKTWPRLANCLPDSSAVMTLPPGVGVNTSYVGHYLCTPNPRA